MKTFDIIIEEEKEQLDELSKSTAMSLAHGAGIVVGVATSAAAGNVAGTAAGTAVSVAGQKAADTMVSASEEELKALDDLDKEDKRSLKSAEGKWKDKIAKAENTSTATKYKKKLTNIQKFYNDRIKKRDVYRQKWKKQIADKAKK